MKPLEIIAIFLSIIQAGTGIAALQVPARLQKNKWFLTFTTTVVFILIVVIINMLPQPIVTITDPTGSRISPQTKVCGTIQNTPSDKDLFVVVKSDRYYPFMAVPNGSTWESSEVISIGDSSAGTGKFEVLVVLVPGGSLVQKKMRSGEPFELLFKDMEVVARKEFLRDSKLPKNDVCSSR
jgi:hypothetical protein